jgi:hypothetical protein
LIVGGRIRVLLENFGPRSGVGPKKLTKTAGNLDRSSNTEKFVQALPIRVLLV